MNAAERRKHPRFQGEFPVDLLNTGEDRSTSPWEAVVPAVALDVSRQGLRMKSRYNVPPGTYLSAIVYFKGQGSVCLCEVVWRREESPDTTLYGLFVREWSKIDPALDRELNAMESSEKKSEGSGGEFSGVVALA